jgi:hypothetical protein
MSDVTRILSQIESGDPAAAEQLLPLVYDELTAERDWTYARTWLFCRLAEQSPAENSSKNPSTA